MFTGFICSVSKECMHTYVGAIYIYNSRAYIGIQT